MSIVSENLRKMRGGRTQDEMANFLGVKYKRYQSLENGIEPDVALLETIRNKGYDLNWFITGEGNMLISESSFKKECCECKELKEKLTEKSEKIIDLQGEIIIVQRQLHAAMTDTQEERIRKLVKEECNKQSPSREAIPSSTGGNNPDNR